MSASVSNQPFLVFLIQSDERQGPNIAELPVKEHEYSVMNTNAGRHL